jgi:hypothetical protein
MTLPFRNSSMAVRSIVYLVKIAVLRSSVSILVCAVHPAMHWQSSPINIIAVSMPLYWLKLFSVCFLFQNVCCWYSALLLRMCNVVSHCYTFMTSASQFPARSLPSSHPCFLCEISQSALSSAPCIFFRWGYVLTLIVGMCRVVCSRGPAAPQSGFRLSFVCVWDISNKYLFLPVFIWLFLPSLSSSPSFYVLILAIFSISVSLVLLPWIIGGFVSLFIVLVKFQALWIFTFANLNLVSYLFFCSPSLSVLRAPKWEWFLCSTMCHAWVSCDGLPIVWNQDSGPSIIK